MKDKQCRHPWPKDEGDVRFLLKERAIFLISNFCTIPMNDDLKIWLEYIKEITKIDKNIRSSFAPRVKIHQQEITPEPNYQQKRKKTYAIEAKIDLHGLTQDQAFEGLTRFIENCYKANKQYILIVTGKGNMDQPGVIKLVVPRWLEYTELKQYVLSYSTAKYELGGEGAVAVVLKRKPKEK